MLVTVWAYRALESPALRAMGGDRNSSLTLQLRQNPTHSYVLNSTMVAEPGYPGFGIDPPFWARVRTQDFLSVRFVPAGTVRVPTLEFCLTLARRIVYCRSPPRSS